MTWGEVKELLNAKIADDEEVEYIDSTLGVHENIRVERRTLDDQTVVVAVWS